MEDNITLDFRILKKFKINANEYLDLLHLYSIKKKINPKFVQSYKRGDHLYDLAQRDWLFVNVIGTEIKIELRDKVYSLFEGDKDYFLEWFSKFPIKTPSGRALKVQSSDTNAGRELHKKWKKHFRNKSDAARKAIQVLEAEMNWRRRNGKFEFMHNAATWLNQFDYEKHEYMLDEMKVTNEKKNEDYL